MIWLLTVLMFALGMHFLSSRLAKVYARLKLEAVHQALLDLAAEWRVNADANDGFGYTLPDEMRATAKTCANELESTLNRVLGA
jgi:hypothetical protein